MKLLTLGVLLSIAVTLSLCLPVDKLLKKKIFKGIQPTVIPEDQGAKPKQNINSANKKDMPLIFEVDDRRNQLPEFLSNTFNASENTQIRSKIGPKINQKSCGNITIRENISVPNMMQIFALQEVNETSNFLFWHIEGS